VRDLGLLSPEGAHSAGGVDPLPGTGGSHDAASPSVRLYRPKASSQPSDAAPRLG
jgi:hypothetical protein